MGSGRNKLARRWLCGSAPFLSLCRLKCLAAHKFACVSLCPPTAGVSALALRVIQAGDRQASERRELPHLQTSARRRAAATKAWSRDAFVHIRSGAVREIAARSFVLRNPEKCHERASHCAFAFDESSCERQRLRNGNRSIVLSGMPRTDVIQQLNALCGRPCWRWTDFVATHKK